LKVDELIVIRTPANFYALGRQKNFSGLKNNFGCSERQILFFS